MIKLLTMSLIDFEMRMASPAVDDLHYFVMHVRFCFLFTDPVGEQDPFPLDARTALVQGYFQLLQPTRQEWNRRGREGCARHLLVAKMSGTHK